MINATSRAISIGDVPSHPVIVHGLQRAFNVRVNRPCACTRLCWLLLLLVTLLPLRRPVQGAYGTRLHLGGRLSSSTHQRRSVSGVSPRYVGARNSFADAGAMQVSDQQLVALDRREGSIYRRVCRRYGCSTSHASLVSNLIAHLQEKVPVRSVQFVDERGVPSPSHASELLGTNPNIFVYIAAVRTPGECSCASVASATDGRVALLRRMLRASSGHSRRRRSTLLHSPTLTCSLQVVSHCPTSSGSGALSTPSCGARR